MWSLPVLIGRGLDLRKGKEGREERGSSGSEKRRKAKKDEGLGKETRSDLKERKDAESTV